MNYDELKAEFGSAEQAADAVASGAHPLNGDDFISWPEGFRSLILFKQGQTGTAHAQRVAQLQKPAKQTAVPPAG